MPVITALPFGLPARVAIIYYQYCYKLKNNIIAVSRKPQHHNCMNYKMTTVILEEMVVVSFTEALAF